MKGLLIKDFKLLKMQRNFYLMLGVIVIVMAFGIPNMGFVLVYPTLIVPMFAISTISYDEFDNGYPFLFSLPFTRREYVWSKYAFLLILSGASLLFTCFVVMSVGMIRDGVAGISLHAAEVAGALSELVVVLPPILAVTVLLQSVSIPLHLKFGAEKARLMRILLAGGVVAVGFLFSALLDMMDIDLDRVLSELGGTNAVLTVLISLGLAVLSLLVSSKVSMHILEKKEF